MFRQTKQKKKIYIRWRTLIFVINKRKFILIRTCFMFYYVFYFFLAFFYVILICLECISNIPIFILHDINNEIQKVYKVHTPNHCFILYILFTIRDDNIIHMINIYMNIFNGKISLTQYIYNMYMWF